MHYIFSALFFKYFSIITCQFASQLLSQQYNCMFNKNQNQNQPYSNIKGSEIVLKIFQNNQHQNDQQQNQHYNQNQKNTNRTNNLNRNPININSLIYPNGNKNVQNKKSNGQAIYAMSKKLLQQKQFKKILQDLDLKVKLDNSEDCQQLKKILFQVLKYPSSQLAQLHSQADRLGNFDLPQQRERQNQLFNQLQTQQDNQYCSCCGFIRQQEQLKICSQSLQDVQNIGISTFLYFRTVLNIILLLLTMFVVYAIYALVTNIVASRDNSLISNQNYLILSMGAKQLNPTDRNNILIFVQAWIGFALVIIWGFIFFYLQHVQKSKQQEVSRESITAADFSVLIENLPIQMDQHSLQKQFDDYSKQQSLKPIKITSFNEGKPFYLNQNQIYNQRVKAIIEQQANLRQKIVNFIIQRQEGDSFQTPKQQRYKILFDYRCNQQNKQNEYFRAVKQIQSKLKQNNIMQTTTAFVSFQTNKQKQILTKGSSDKFYKKIKQFIPCFQNQKKFMIKLRRVNTFDESLSYIQQHKVNIQKSPQPEDVQWTNIGISDCQIICKKGITYTVTGLILGASFVIVYGLSLLQNNNSSSRYLSFFISFIISLINIIISQVIRRLCAYERNLTKTRYQTSLALKSVFAQLINSILIPIMTNRFIKNNIFQKNGLVDDIFLLGITNAFLCPILKIFDSYYYYVRFMAWYTNRATYKLQLRQFQLNQYSSLIQFQVGYQYIYVINLFLFTCFFVSLQPIISVFSILGLCLMYWAQKYSLFSRCRRPIPGTNILHAYLTQLIYLGGIVYSLGSLMWTNFLPQGTPKYALIPNLCALGGGVIIMFLPYGLISQLLKQSDNQDILQYQKCKKFLPSEYDRLNPVTSKQAIQKFKKYMIQQKQKLKYVSKEAQDNVLKLFKKQGKYNFHRSNDAFNNPFLGAISNVVPVQNNSINPQFAANFLFGGIQSSNNLSELKQIVNFGNQMNLNHNEFFMNAQNEQVTNALFGNLDNFNNKYQAQSNMRSANLNQDQTSGNQLVHMFQRNNKINKDQID